MATPAQMNSKMLEQLAEVALSVRLKAYAPYSHFQVGAAIWGANGKIYAGCNVENASYGLTVCAERNAVFAMIADGCQEISAIAIALPKAGSPCGACRQVLTEFGRKFPVILVNSDNGKIEAQWDIQALLPAAFSGPL